MMKMLAAGIAALLISTAAAAETAIKIGVLNGRSGVYAELSGEGSVAAARLAVEDFDAAGKGLKVEIVSGDHQNRPDTGSQIARQWYGQEGVDVIVDVPASAVALAVSQIARETNKLFLASGAASADLTGVSCSPNTIHWTYDTWALTHGAGGAMVKQGGDTWFFITAGNASGKVLERETSIAVKAAGGKVSGSVQHPFPGQDFSPFLLQAQGSGAKVVGLANAGADTANAIKQASDFGIVQGGQSLAGLMAFITDVHALGRKTAQGLVLTEAFYWDLNDDTRVWSKRFAERHGGKMPTMVHAGVYSAVTHYLKALAALNGDKDAAKVAAKMKETPTDDPLFGKGVVRADGRKVHPMYLFKVKKPEESQGPWDYYTLLATIPAEEAFRPLKDGNCPLIAR